MKVISANLWHSSTAFTGARYAHILDELRHDAAVKTAAIVPRPRPIRATGGLTRRWSSVRSGAAFVYIVSHSTECRIRSVAFKYLRSRRGPG
jgi:hypothetical protein